MKISYFPLPVLYGGFCGFAKFAGMREVTGILGRPILRFPPEAASVIPLGSPPPITHTLGLFPALRLRLRPGGDVVRSLDTWSARHVSESHATKMQTKLL